MAILKNLVFQNRQILNIFSRKGLVGLIDAKGIDVAQPIWL